MNFDEDMALEAYQNALRDMDAFRPTYDQTLTLQSVDQSGEAPAPKPGAAEIRRHWLELVARVESTKAELDRVRGS